MAISTNSIINATEINTEFITRVMNVILSGAYDINNAPMDGIYECIQRERLGNKNSLPTPNVGRKDGIISAAALYNNLVSVTTTLTRVGTFSYTRYFEQDSSLILQFSRSGKALFTSAYVKTLASVPKTGIETDQIISASNINLLLANLLTAWSNTVRHHNVITNTLCHGNCHSDCYSDCHSDCDCYK